MRIYRIVLAALISCTGTWVHAQSVLAPSAGGTGENNSGTISVSTNVSIFGSPFWMYAPTSAFYALPPGPVTSGYPFINVASREIQQNPQSSSYPLQISDDGKMLYNSSGGAVTFTIPANASVNYPIGTTLTFVNPPGTTGNLTIAINSDSLWLSPSGAGGTGIPRTLGPVGLATAVKINTTTWIISGTNLT